MKINRRKTCIGLKICKKKKAKESFDSIACLPSANLPSSELRNTREGFQVRL